MSLQHKKTFTDRLWNEEPFIELVKIIGYQGCLVSACYEQAKPLLEKYGQKTMEEIGTLIARMEGDGNTCKAFLKDEVRLKVWPILGPDPENQPWRAKKEEKLFDEPPKKRKKNHRRE